MFLRKIGSNRKGDIMEGPIIWIVIGLVVAAVAIFAIIKYNKSLASAGSCEDDYCTAYNEVHNPEYRNNDYCPPDYSKGLASCTYKDKKGKCCVKGFD